MDHISKGQCVQGVTAGGIDYYERGNRMMKDSGMMPVLCLLCAVLLWLSVSVLILSGGLVPIAIALEVSIYCLGIVLIVEGFLVEIRR